MEIELQKCNDIKNLIGRIRQAEAKLNGELRDTKSEREKALMVRNYEFVATGALRHLCNMVDDALSKNEA